MTILAYILTGLSLLMSALYFIKLKYPSFTLLLKLLAIALSPYWAIMGVVGVLIGWVCRGPNWVGIWCYLGCSDWDPWRWLDGLVCLAMYAGAQRL